MTLYIYRMGRTYPARNPFYKSKSMKILICTRIPHGPVKPVSHCQTGYRDQTAWVHQSDRLMPNLVVDILDIRLDLSD